MTQAEFLMEAVKQGVQHAVQYVDFGPDEWTSPSILTEERLSRLLDDLSVTRIRLVINVFNPSLAGEE